MSGRGAGELEDIIKRLEREELSPGVLDDLIGNRNLAALVRRLYLERRLNVNLSSIASTILDFEDAPGRAIENPIGALQIPLAIAGPLKVEGSHAVGEYYIPLATTRRGLVRLLDEAITVAGKCGGVKATATRGPATGSILIRIPPAESPTSLLSRINYSEKQLEEALLRALGGEGGVSIYAVPLSGSIHVRAVLPPGSPSEQVESALKALCVEIERIIPSSEGCLVLGGRMQGASAIQAFAEVEICPDAAASGLGVSMEALGEAAAFGAAAIQLNSMEERCLDYLTVLASFLLATGQDLAGLARAGRGLVLIEPGRNGATRVLVGLPGLELDLSGPGVMLPTQREALSLLGLPTGDPNRDTLKLAEIAAAIVASWELGRLVLLAKSLGEGSAEWVGVDLT